MSHLIQPVVSPKGRVIVLSGATLLLIAVMALSAAPGGASAATPTPESRDLGLVTDGTPIERLAGTDDYLYYPRVIADGGQIFVTDSGTHRVIRLDDGLAADTVFGREGAGPGELMEPFDVAVDSQGNVFVVDVGLARINKYAADGTFVRSVGAPRVASLMIDSNDELIVYPAPGDALMQRYSNDLEPGEGLLEDTHVRLHNSSLGVLAALDAQDRMFVLDQVTLTFTIYDADMTVVRSWDVNAPDLRSSMDALLADRERRNPNASHTVVGFQAMALSPSGNQVALHYFVKRGEDPSFSRVAWFDLDGNRLVTEDRTSMVFANALTNDGRLIEGTQEAIVIFQRGQQNRSNAGTN